MVWSVGFHLLVQFYYFEQIEGEYVSSETTGLLFEVMELRPEKSYNGYGESEIV